MKRSKGQHGFTLDQGSGLVSRRNGANQASVKSPAFNATRIG
jgi:hypothetical protein